MEALADYEAAYRLDPHPVLARNLARLYLQLARFDDGITFVEGLLAANPPAADRQLPAN